MIDDDAVTASTAEFHRNARLKHRDPRVIVAGELSTHPVDAIRVARVPDKYVDLDKEIKD